MIFYKSLGSCCGNCMNCLYDISITVPVLTYAVLDHKDNYSVMVLFPYELVNSEVQFGEVFAQEGANEIFNQ